MQRVQHKRERLPAGGALRGARHPRRHLLYSSTANQLLINY